MTDSEIARLEAEFQIKLPGGYREILQRAAEEFVDWPPEDAAASYLLTDLQKLLELNRAVRKSPDKYVREPAEMQSAWPVHLFVCGERPRMSILVIDCTEKEKRLLEIDTSKKKLTKSAGFKDLVDLYKAVQTHYRQLMKRVKKRAKFDGEIAKKSSFSAADIIAEGERLSRPCLLLKSDGKEKTGGFWGGPGHQKRPSGYMLEESGVESRHWISVDCAWLAEQNILHPQLGTGHLSVYERTLPKNHPLAAHRGHDFIVIWSEVPLGKAGIEGVPLRATPATSFPPFEAVCMHGGPAVETWVTALERRRVDYEDAMLRDTAPGRAYQREWDRRTPWWPEGDDGTAAVLGGWHLMWPDDDFYVPPETQPVLWTLRDSEPWIEVRRGCRNFLVFDRVT